MNNQSWLINNQLCLSEIYDIWTKINDSWSKNMIFQKVVDFPRYHRHSAHNFAAVVSSMVLEHLFTSRPSASLRSASGEPLPHSDKSPSPKLENEFTSWTQSFLKRSQIGKIIHFLPEKVPNWKINSLPGPRRSWKGPKLEKQFTSWTQSLLTRSQIG